jgi:DNA-binding NarL/FixJ family response regulator
LVSVAVQETGELRRVGYHDALLSDKSLSLFSGTVEEAIADRSVQVLLIGRHSSNSIFDRIVEVRKQRPDLRILIASSHGDDETIIRCIQAGAKGYIDETCSIALLLQAIHVVAGGSIWAPRRLLSQFIDRMLDSPHGVQSANRVNLTARERQVLELLVGGYSNREIARRLGIEERTVKAHIAKLLRKVGVPNRISLTMYTIHKSLLNS